MSEENQRFSNFFKAKSWTSRHNVTKFSTQNTSKNKNKEQNTRATERSASTSSQNNLNSVTVSAARSEKTKRVSSLVGYTDQFTKGRPDCI